MMREPRASRERRERGAIVVHVAVTLLGLLAFSAFTVDYGVMMVSRRQAQAAADAAALAAGAYMAWDDLADQAGAQSVAVAAAQQNGVWGAAPDVTVGDVTFPVCPPGAPGPPDTCVRADVFRNQRANGNALPIFFGGLVGMPDQGVRATATAQVVASDTADCLKPFGIYDKWLENDGAGGWRLPDPTVDFFERYDDNSTDLLPEPDLYIDRFGNCPAGGSCAGLPLVPTGYDAAVDYGQPIVIKGGQPSTARVAPGLYHPVVINPDEGPGGSNYRDNIEQCDDYVHTIPNDPSDPPYVLDFEPGNMIGPTRQGIIALMGADNQASWFDPDGPGGTPGYPVNTCMQTGTCIGLDGEFTGISPRWLGVPLFNPDEYDYGRASGRQTVEIVDIIGLWLEGFCSDAGITCPPGSSGNDILAYMTHYPSLAAGDLSGDVTSSFLRTVILVR